MTNFVQTNLSLYRILLKVKVNLNALKIILIGTNENIHPLLIHPISNLGLFHLVRTLDNVIMEFHINKQKRLK